MDLGRESDVVSLELEVRPVALRMFGSLLVMLGTIKVCAVNFFVMGEGRERGGKRRKGSGRGVEPDAISLELEVRRITLGMFGLLLEMLDSIKFCSIPFIVVVEWKGLKVEGWEGTSLSLCLDYELEACVWIDRHFKECWAHC